MLVIIGDRTIFLHSDSTPKIPHFLRVDGVRLIYHSRFGPSIAEKCQTVVNNLEPFKKALIDSNVVNFVGQISQNHNSFNDHLQLLTHVREELMPIFASSRRYKFAISLNDDYNSITKVIADGNVISSII